MGPKPEDETPAEEVERRTDESGYTVTGHEPAVPQPTIYNTLGVPVEESRAEVLDRRFNEHLAAAGEGRLVQGREFPMTAEESPDGPPFISAVALGDEIRNARELAFWVLGSIHGERLVRVRIRTEHLAGVAAVLVQSGYRVSRFSQSFIAGEAGETTLEIEAV